MAELKPTCCGRMSLGGYRGAKLCGVTAKFERDGRHYCGIHDPVAREAREDVKIAKRLAIWSAKNAAYDAGRAKQAELERRSGCFDDLREALEMALQIIAVQNGNLHDDTNQAQAIMKAAIAKSKGELP